MEDLIRSALEWAGPLQSVEAFKKRPVATQRTLLRDLLTRAADTEWGRRYGFAEIAGAPDVIEAYQERVPLHTYDDIANDVQRVREGAPDVMWPGTVTNFAVSSGTVSDGKIIPITQETIDHNRSFSVGTGIHYLKETLDGRFFLGNHLTLPGRVEEDPDYPGTLAGEISGILAENAPDFFSTFFQAVPNEVAFIPNWEKKLRAIAERTVDQDIRLLVMAPTWALTLFDELIAIHNERHGATATTVGEVWPNLQLLIAGGVPLRSYRDLLEERIGMDIDFLETYGASEGFFSFQDDLDDPSMLLHLDNGVFYEFVPLDEEGTAAPRRYTVADVEPGTRYSLYVTSCSGLWSYQVGDVVRFTQTFPHKLTVAGRTSEMIDEYGEALYGDEARAALRAACEATGAHVVDYHIAPRSMNGEEERPGHEWLIEFEVRPEDLDAFAGHIDEHLQSVNRHYQIRREANAFEPPLLSVLPEGTFYAWLKATKDSISGQTKVPRMSTDRTVANGVLDAAGPKA
ncbi:MAG: GH3 auxin-responsive promoter family protein [Salinivenus sp.]